MIFKTREPLPDDAIAQAKEPEDAKTAAPTNEPDAQERETHGDDVLSGAFEAMGQVVAREIESIKHTIAELEVRMARRFESERASVTSTIGELRQDVIARIESLRQGQQKAVTEVGEQSKASIGGLRSQVEPALEKANRRAEEVKAGLEKILTGTEKKLEQELQALTHALSGVRIDLDRQVTTSGRVSDLLNNMADLFSDPGSLPRQSANQASHDVPGSPRSDP